MSTTDKPERARVLTLELQADSDDDLAGALTALAAAVDRGELTKGVSGGARSGYIYELRDGNCADHDEYFARLSAYLAESTK